MSGVKTIVGQALLVIALGGSIGSYEPINHAAAVLHALRTPLDAALPFVPVFAIPYVLYPPYFLLTVLLFGVDNWRRFRVLALAVILASLIADGFYLVFLDCRPASQRARQ